MGTAKYLVFSLISLNNRSMHHLGKVVVEAAVTAAVKGGVSAGVKAATGKKTEETKDDRKATPAISLTVLKQFSQKDLHASIRFFNEGFMYLCKVLGEGVFTGRHVGDDVSSESKAKALPGSVQEHFIISSAALLEAIFLLKDLKDLDESAAKALTDAKERFRDARRKATKAFSNEVLSERERFFAARYRVASTLLEKVDSLEDALGACELCLQELHALPVVQKGFEKHGGSKIIRADVRDINRLVCDVTQVIGGVGAFLSWPCVVVGKRKVDPLHREEMMSSHCCMSKSFGQEGVDEHKLTFAWSITSNTRGDFIVPDSIDRNIKVFNSNGKFVRSVDPFADDPRSYDEIWNIAGDSWDNIYVLTLHRTESVPISSLVYILDKDGHLIQRLPLREGFRGSAVAVDDNSRVFVLGGSFSNFHNDEVQVYQLCQGFVQSFGTKHLINAKDITAADDDRVMVVDGESDPLVFVFSVNGDLLHKFKVSGSLPDTGVAITFHKKSQNVLVASLRPESRVRVSVYEADGHLLRVMQFQDKGGPFITGITATPEGCIAVPGQNRVLFR